MDAEKKYIVARPRETMPFGMKIREAAHKSAFSGSKHGILQRYGAFSKDGSFFEEKKNDQKLTNLDDYLLTDGLSDSSSVSASCSDDSVSLPSIGGSDMTLSASVADLKIHSKLMKKKSKKRISIKDSKTDNVDDKWF